MLTVRIQEKNHSESIMVLKLKDGYNSSPLYGKKSKHPDSDRIIRLLSTAENPNIAIPTIQPHSSLRQKVRKW